MAEIDIARIRDKLSFLREQSQMINQSLAAYEREIASAEPAVPPRTLFLGLEHALQTSVQTVIDIAHHITAKALRVAPRDPYAALEGLVRARAITETTAATCRGMVGFRNRLVQGYETVDPAKVLENARRSGDFEVFAREIEDYLDRLTKER